MQHQIESEQLWHAREWCNVTPSSSAFVLKKKIEIVVRFVLFILIVVLNAEFLFCLGF